MKTRAITGFFFVIVMLCSMLFGHYPFGIFFLALSLFCLWEFYGLIKQTGIQPNLFAGMLNGLFIYGVFALITYQDSVTAHRLLFIIPLLVCIVFIQELFTKSASPFNNIAYTFLGLIFVIVPFTFFHALRISKESLIFITRLHL